MRLPSPFNSPVVRLLSLILFAFAATNLQAQGSIFTEGFDSPASFQNWQVSPVGEPGWEWRADGKADGGPYWGSRQRIATTGGVAVFNSDSLLNVNFPTPHLSELISPTIDASFTEKVWLEFNQYYRNFSSQTTVSVSNDNGMSWTDFPINTAVGKNVETSRFDRVKLDISSVAGSQFEVLVRFRFEGNNYFWIIDNINLTEEEPFPITFPPYLGDSLQALGKPYEIDSLGGAFIPEQMIVQFTPDATDLDRAGLRDTFGVIAYDTCMCKKIELWTLGGPVITDTTGLSAFGGGIGVLSNVEQAASKSKVDDVDLNHYNFNQIQLPGDDPCDPLANLPAGVPQTPSDAIVVAVLDTGVDYNHDSLTNYIWRNDDPAGSGDDDANCLDDDFIGWNFVCDTNNPNDDHSHGTHVAGIVVQNLRNANPGCDFRIMPVKTHDSHGLAELFDVICGTYYAMQEGADVINDSWGYYGIESRLLKNAIDSARITYNTLIVAAAGNDTLSLDEYRQYPAVHELTNIVTVGALNVNNLLAPFSNFSDLEVDIAAPGEDILSTVPGPDSPMDFKSGTSMAAPAVSAAAALAYCLGAETPADAKDWVISCASPFQLIDTLVVDGNVLDLVCLVPTDDLPESKPETPFALFPNPVENQLFLQALTDLPEEADILLTNNLGQVVWQFQCGGLLRSDQLLLDLSRFPPGAYVLTVYTRGNKWAAKLIKG